MPLPVCIPCEKKPKCCQALILPCRRSCWTKGLVQVLTSCSVRLPPLTNTTVLHQSAVLETWPFSHGINEFSVSVLTSAWGHYWKIMSGYKVWKLVTEWRTFLLARFILCTFASGTFRVCLKNPAPDWAKQSNYPYRIPNLHLCQHDPKFSISQTLQCSSTRNGAYYCECTCLCEMKTHCQQIHLQHDMNTMIKTAWSL